MEWLRGAASRLPQGRLEETWPVPFLTMLTNGDAPAKLARVLGKVVKRLSWRTRLDWWALRFAFAMGALVFWARKPRLQIPETAPAFGQSHS